MSDVPYDVVVPVSVTLLTDVTFQPFMNTRVRTLQKRQTLSSSNLITIDELVRMCPLDDVQDQDVPAGCIAGIFNKLCSNPSNATLLAQCHIAYDQAFAASVFKPLEEVCPAWKKGPRSFSCGHAIHKFSFKGLNKKKGNMIRLTTRHAKELVRMLFENPRFAPCTDESKCTWHETLN